MGCGVYWQQIHELERALGTMERFGISATDPAYMTLERQRGALFGQVGMKFPRITTPIKEVSVWGSMTQRLMEQIIGSAVYTLLEVRDATIRLWHDVEAGWMSEARIKPSAEPVYKAVSDEIAMAILKGEPTGKMMAQLLTPDDYLGE